MQQRGGGVWWKGGSQGLERMMEGIIQGVGGFVDGVQEFLNEFEL